MKGYRILLNLKQFGPRRDQAQPIQHIDPQSVYFATLVDHEETYAMDVIRGACKETQS